MVVYKRMGGFKIRNGHGKKAKNETGTVNIVAVFLNFYAQIFIKISTLSSCHYHRKFNGTLFLNKDN